MDWFLPLFLTESLFNRRAARRKNRIGLPLGSDRTAVQAFSDRVWAFLATRLRSFREAVAYAFASLGAAEICAKKRVELQRSVSQGVVKQAQNFRISRSCLFILEYAKTERPFVKLFGLIFKTAQPCGMRDAPICLSQEKPGQR